MIAKPKSNRRHYEIKHGASDGVSRLYWAGCLP
jgi:hypothetical protein